MPTCSASSCEAQGSFVFDEAARTVSDIQVTIDAASVFSNHEARDQHVRKPDFLDVPAVPDHHFVGTRRTATGPDTGK